MQATSNVISLHAIRGRNAMNVEESPVRAVSVENEQRAESRELIGERLFVQIIQAGDQALVGKTISCTAVDASANGIKFLTKEFVPVGCLLDLWVDDATRPGKFFLSGDARWTQSVGIATTLVGVRLQQGAATDLDEWQVGRA
jgi:hypothetical protein